MRVSPAPISNILQLAQHVHLSSVIQAKKKGAHMVESTWRELCKKIMDEKDPRRLMTLVEALNKELDQREQELRSRRQHPVAQS